VQRIGDLLAAVCCGSRNKEDCCTMVVGDGSGIGEDSLTGRRGDGKDLVTERLGNGKTW
jgi:hypothetical protein